MPAKQLLRLFSIGIDGGHGCSPADGSAGGHSPFGDTPMHPGEHGEEDHAPAMLVNLTTTRTLVDPTTTRPIWLLSFRPRTGVDLAHPPSRSTHPSRRMTARRYDSMLLGQLARCAVERCARPPRRRAER